MPRTISARRHSIKPSLLVEADRAAMRAARHLERRYRLTPATARAVAEAANLATAEARR